MAHYICTKGRYSIENMGSSASILNDHSEPLVTDTETFKLLLYEALNLVTDLVKTEPQKLKMLRFCSDSVTMLFLSHLEDIISMDKFDTNIVVSAEEGSSSEFRISTYKIEHSDAFAKYREKVENIAAKFCKENDLQLYEMRDSLCVGIVNSILKKSILSYSYESLAKLRDHLKLLVKGEAIDFTSLQDMCVIENLNCKIVKVLHYLDCALDFKAFMAMQQKNFSKRIDKQIYMSGDIIKTEEMDTVEFKLSQRNVKGILETILRYACAFLNSNGGVLMQGINDDGKIVGVCMSGKERDILIGQFARDSVKLIIPTVGDFKLSHFPGIVEIYFVPVFCCKSNCKVVRNDKDVVVIETVVRPWLLNTSICGDRKPLFQLHHHSSKVKEEAWVKRGSSVQDLNTTNRKEFIQRLANPLAHSSKISLISKGQNHVDFHQHLFRDGKVCLHCLNSDCEDVCHSIYKENFAAPSKEKQTNTYRKSRIAKSSYRGEKIDGLTLPKMLIGRFIGHQGSNINKIAKLGGKKCKIWIDDSDGSIYLKKSSENQEQNVINAIGKWIQQHKVSQKNVN